MTEVSELCCPHCLYDVRGLPEPRCPECGQPFGLLLAADVARLRHRIRRLRPWVATVFGAWFGAYVLLPNVFAGTLDYVDSIWIAIPWLCAPCHLTVMGLTAAFVFDRRQRFWRAGIVGVGISFTLIAGHLVITGVVMGTR